jgi:hypothetical protein
MKEAHKATKEFFQRVPSSKMSYASILKENLVTAHKEFKAMQAQKTIKLSLIGSTLEADKDASWFSLEGTATDSEGYQVRVQESGGTLSVQASADWYFNHTNGFTNIDLYACVWGLEDVKESFKIVR